MVVFMKLIKKTHIQNIQRTRTTQKEKHRQLVERKDGDLKRSPHERQLSKNIKQQWGTTIHLPSKWPKLNSLRITWIETMQNNDNSHGGTWNGSMTLENSLTLSSNSEI